MQVEEHLEGTTLLFFCRDRIFIFFQELSFCNYFPRLREVEFLFCYVLMSILFVCQESSILLLTYSQLVWTLEILILFLLNRWAFQHNKGCSFHKLYVSIELLSNDIKTLFLKGSSYFIISFLVIGQSKSIEQKGKFMIGLASLSFPIAINSFFEILDSFLSFILINTFLTDKQIGRASLAIVLMHH